MFAIDAGGKLRRIKRRPGNWERLTCWDTFHFIPENRGWDADEREWIAAAIGLTELSPDMHMRRSDAWLRRRALEFCAKRPCDWGDPDAESEG